ncbi:MAG: hypothetical protein AAF821_26210 [Cyanobacteria bacterium P01_D01_bin.156]
MTKAYISSLSHAQCAILWVDVTTIDMLTVVLIGNSRTFLHQGRMITPRGYKV